LLSKAKDLGRQADHPRRNQMHRCAQFVTLVVAQY
jgi:hypothetical protein